PYRGGRTCGLWRRAVRIAGRNTCAAGNAGLVAGPTVQRLWRLGRPRWRRQELVAGHALPGHCFLRLRGCVRLAWARPCPGLGLECADVRPEGLFRRAGLRLLGSLGKPWPPTHSTNTLDGSAASC